MSWINDIQDKIFEIVTGDGKSYFPKWRNAVKTREYNVAQFDFIGVEGSYVDRRKAKSRRFELEFYFDGESAVDLGNNFEISARDKRKWLLKHPFYGDIYCHPLSLTQDNTQYNVSRFTVPVVETLPEGYPKYDIEFADVIVETQVSANDVQAEAFGSADVMDRNALQNTTDYLDSIFSAMIDDENDLNRFKALVDTAVVDIGDVTASATQIIRSMQNLINYPATVVQTVKSRFNVFSEAVETLIENITGIAVTSRTRAEKVQFEAVIGGLITAQQIACSTEIEGFYFTRQDVIDQQDLLLADYDSFLEVLDENQSDRADTEDAYVPDFESINEIENIVFLSVANLYTIAFKAKQERIFINDRDSNAILLSHKFYGTDTDDENLEYFIDTNNIGLNEILNIRKGRKILYYV